MKTAISVPDADFERFEQVAARHGMNRSEFSRLAARSPADELEGGSRLTAIGNAVLSYVREFGRAEFTEESERLLRDIEW